MADEIEGPDPGDDRVAPGRGAPPGADSFPASDPPGGWAGPDEPTGTGSDGVARGTSSPTVIDPAAGGERRGTGGNEHGRGDGADDDDLVADPIPEADSDETAAAWEVEDPMGGQSPTG